jgi:hypothetical protein
LRVGVIVASIVVLLAVAEVAVRHVVEHRIATAAGKGFTGPIHVGIGATPALVDAITGHVSKVTVHAPSTNVCQLQAVDAEATLHDVRRSGSTVTIHGTTVEATLTTQTFTALLESDFPGVTVRPDPANQTIQVAIGPAGLVDVGETARLDGDTITFTATDLSVLGHPVPATIQAQVTKRLTVKNTLSGLPLDLSPRSLSVTPDGIEITLQGGPTTVRNDSSLGHRCAQATSPARS